MRVSSAISDEFRGRSVGSGGDSVRPFALSAASEVAEADRDGSSMAEAAASVLAVGTLAQPAIAIAEPSASPHHRNPLIALSFPHEYTNFSAFPTVLQTGGPSRGIRPRKRNCAGV